MNKQGLPLTITLAFLILLPIYLYWESLVSLVGIWKTSNTYGHGFLIIPIVVWLVYRKKSSLLALPIKFSLVFVIGLLGSSVLWFLAKLAGINVAEHFAVFLLPAFIVATIWGKSGLRLLSFPLFFLFFAVPVGDFLIPYLQFITADIAVFMLELLNIPVFRDGMFIQISNGNFLVAEACSGIRFLISTITIGVLFAYLNMNSTKRRTIFILLSIFVPILGNGLRAFLMILIGHLSDMKAAVGFDHLVYGWFFFGFIIIILMGIGNYMAESKAPISNVIPIDESSVNKSYFHLSFLVIILIVSSMSVGPVANYLYMQKAQSLKVAKVADEVIGNDGEVTLLWQPLYINADAVYHKNGELEDKAGELYLIEYLYEAHNKELISGENTLFDKDTWSLDSINNGEIKLNSEGDVVPYIEYKIVNLKGQRRTIRLVYQVDGRYYAQKLKVKFAQLVGKLLMTDLGGKAWVFSYQDIDLEPLNFEMFMKHELLRGKIENMSRVH